MIQKKMGSEEGERTVVGRKIERSAMQTQCGQWRPIGGTEQSQLLGTECLFVHAYTRVLLWASFAVLSGLLFL